MPSFNWNLISITPINSLSPIPQTDKFIYQLYLLLWVQIGQIGEKNSEWVFHFHREYIKCYWQTDSPTVHTKHNLLNQHHFVKLFWQFAQITQILFVFPKDIWHHTYYKITFITNVWTVTIRKSFHQYRYIPPRITVEKCSMLFLVPMELISHLAIKEGKPSATV